MKKIVLCLPNKWTFEYIFKRKIYLCW